MLLTRRELAAYSAELAERPDIALSRDFEPEHIVMPDIIRESGKFIYPVLPGKPESGPV